MDHGEAVQTQIVEKYLLGELSASQEDEFAEHFFDCEECASDVRLTSQFIDTTRKVLTADRAAGPRLMKPSRRWIPAPYAVAASIALLAFTLYQNILVIPGLRSSAAPQAVAVFSLAGMGARSGGPTVVAPVPGEHSVLMLDIAPHDNISEYRCQLLSPGGSTVVSIDVSEEAARNAVSLFIPASVLKTGDYQLAISGRSKDSTTFTELERHPLHVN